MFVRKRGNTAQRTGSSWRRGRLKAPFAFASSGPTPARQWSAQKQVAGRCTVRSVRSLAADATSLSLQVSWHFVAFPEPAPHRSLLPGAASRPLSIMIQDLPLTPQELGGLRFLSHRSLCLYVGNACSSHRSQRHEVRGEASSWRPRGGKSSSWAMATAQRRTGDPSRPNHLFVSSLIKPCFHTGLPAFTSVCGSNKFCCCWNAYWMLDFKSPELSVYEVKCLSSRQLCSNR